MAQFVKIEDNIISLIAKKYERTEKSLAEDVTTLKNWMVTQAHLPELLDDKSIQNFLILNKCSVERAKQKIDMYYTLRSVIPDMVENINPKSPNMVAVMKIGIWVLFPKLTKDLYRLWVFKMRNKDLVGYMEPHDVMGQIINLQEIRLKEDVMFGDVFIFDLEGVSFGYMAKMTPSFVTKMFALYDKIYSIPLKAVYVVNSPSYLDTLMMIVKHVLKPKLFDRINVCQDTSILSERLPKENLPKDYGGDGPSVEELHDLLQVKLNQYQDRFDQLDKLRVNESLRPDKLENDDILGFYGNFKKLSVD